MKVAVIPARGGSKRIPRKNIKPFLGRPMIAYTIEAALKSGVFDRIIVSTDDEEIAAVARTCGAETPFLRPAELSDDHAGTAEVVAHAIRWLENEGQVPDLVCCMYAAAPFITDADLKEGLLKLQESDWHFVFSAGGVSCPIFRSFFIDETHGVNMFFPENYESRSQDLPVALHDAGQFYWGTRDAWLSDQPIFGPSSTVVMIPRWRLQDIDNPEDWEYAEMLFAVAKEKQAS